MTEEAVDYSVLESRIGYRFRDHDLMVRCLFHASASEGRDARAAREFQRFEFLGDRVLGLGIAELLLKIHPNEDEGQISRRHAFLVDQESLASIASEIGLDAWIALSRGERQSIHRRNAAILADGLESLLAGIYLDGGQAAACMVIEKLWKQRVADQREPPLNPKSALQETLQARGLPLPDYHLIAVRGSESQPVFEIELRVPGLEPVRAEGTSKRIATTAAARMMLAALGHHDA